MKCQQVAMAGLGGGRARTRWVWRAAGLAVLCGSMVAAHRPVLAQTEAQLAAVREQMVRHVIVGGGITHPGVIEAMRMTPRHHFVPPRQRERSYLDMALPIGEQQTISSPYIVAFMTQTLDPKPTDKVLEIGTGSGYQAAVLSPLVQEVYTIEIVPELGEQADRTLRRLGYRNVQVKVGDGFEGWPEHAPFDAIIVTCSPESVPKPLVEQLKEGGRMIIPVGERYQQTLYRLRKIDGRMQAESLQPTLFVPMTGVAEEQRRRQPDPSKPELVNGDFEMAPMVPGQQGRRGTPTPAETADVAPDKAVPGAAPGATAQADAPPGAPPGAQAGAPPGARGGLGLPRAEEGPFVAGWYYQRQARLSTQPPVPSGKQYVVFQNAEPGRDSHLLQGLPIDGTKVQRLWLSAHVSGNQLQPGPTIEMYPNIAIVFYDEQRREVGVEALGPWQGTFDWQLVSQQIRVPSGAQEAILRVGLFGSVGTLGVDNVQLSLEAPQGAEGDRGPAARRGRDRRSSGRASRRAADR